MKKRKLIFKTETETTTFGNLIYTLYNSVNNELSTKNTILPISEYISVIGSKLRNKRNEFLTPDFNLIHRLNDNLVGSGNGYIENYKNILDLVELQLYNESQINGVISGFSSFNSVSGRSVYDTFTIISETYKGEFGTYTINDSGTGYTAGSAKIKTPNNDLVDCEITITGSSISTIINVDNDPVFFIEDVCTIVQGTNNSAQITIDTLTNSFVTYTNDTAKGYVSSISTGGDIDDVTIINGGFSYVDGEEVKVRFEDDTEETLGTISTTTIDNPDYLPTLEERIRNESIDDVIFDNRKFYKPYYVKSFCEIASNSGTGLSIDKETYGIPYVYSQSSPTVENNVLAGALHHDNIDYLYVDNWGNYPDGIPPIEVQRGGGQEIDQASIIVSRGSSVITGFDTNIITSTTGTGTSEFVDQEIVKIVQSGNETAVGFLNSTGNPNEFELILLSRGTGYTTGAVTLEYYPHWSQGSNYGTTLTDSSVDHGGEAAAHSSINITSVSAGNQLYEVKINQNGENYSSETLPEFYIANTGYTKPTQYLRTEDFYNWIVADFSWTDVEFIPLNYVYYTKKITDPDFDLDSIDINLILYVVLVIGTVGTGGTKEFKLMYRIKSFEDNRIPVYNDYINIKENYNSYENALYPEFPTDDLIPLNKYVGVDIGFVDLNYDDISDLIEYTTFSGEPKINDILLKQMYLSNLNDVNFNKHIYVDKNNILKVNTIDSNYTTNYQSTGKKALYFDLSTESIDLQLEGVIEYDENIIEVSNLLTSNKPFIQLFTERRMILFDYENKEIILEVSDYLNENKSYTFSYELEDINEGIFIFNHKYGGVTRYYYVDYNSKDTEIITNITNKNVSNEASEYPITISNYDIPQGYYKFKLNITNNTNFDDSDIPTTVQSYIQLQRGNQILEEKYDIINDKNISLVVTIKDFPLYIKYVIVGNERQFAKYIDCNIQPIKEL